MNMEELVVRLCIEKDNKNSERKLFFQAIVRSNVVEHGQNSK